jgi:hypothetical protein
MKWMYWALLNICYVNNFIFYMEGSWNEGNHRTLLLVWYVSKSRKQKIYPLITISILVKFSFLPQSRNCSQEHIKWNYSKSFPQTIATFTCSVYKVSAVLTQNSTTLMCVPLCIAGGRPLYLNGQMTSSQGTDYLTRSCFNLCEMMSLWMSSSSLFSASTKVKL